MALGGGISGFIVGLIGTGGALRATFLTGLKIDKEKYITTAAVIALGTDATIPARESLLTVVRQSALVISTRDD